MRVLRERKKLTNKINAGYLCSYSLETTLVHEFCCRCSRSKHAAKQGQRYRFKVRYRLVDCRLLPGRSLTAGPGRLRACFARRCCDLL